jgi:hypothetical protein
MQRIPERLSTNRRMGGRRDPGTAADGRYRVLPVNIGCERDRAATAPQYPASPVRHPGKASVARLAYALVLVALALLAAGCALRGHAKTAKAAPVPAAPATARPTPPPELLSIPQTQVQLPPLQPLSQAALAAAEEPPVVELPEPPAPRGTNRPTASRAPSVPRSEAPAPAPATPPAQAQTPEPERPIVVEKISPEEQRRLTDSIAVRRREIAQALDSAAARGPNAEERGLIARIRTSLDLADRATARGDLRQADALAERAQILSRELQSVR